MLELIKCCKKVWEPLLKRQIINVSISLQLSSSLRGCLNNPQDWLVREGGVVTVWPAASLLWVCRCSRCFSAPAALAKRRQRTETRPTSFILHPMMEVTQESTLAQNKSQGVTDGVAEREGISLASKVSFVFHLRKAAVGTVFMTAPARLAFWLCKAPWLWEFEH